MDLHAKALAFLGGWGAQDEEDIQWRCMQGPWVRSRDWKRFSVGRRIGRRSLEGASLGIAPAATADLDAHFRFAADHYLCKRKARFFIVVGCPGSSKHCLLTPPVAVYCRGPIQYYKCPSASHWAPRSICVLQRSKDEDDIRWLSLVEGCPG